MVERLLASGLTDIGELEKQLSPSQREAFASGRRRDPFARPTLSESDYRKLALEKVSEGGLQ